MTKHVRARILRSLLQLFSYFFPILSFTIPNIYPHCICIISRSIDTNSFQGLLDLALTVRGLKPPEWQTVWILHCSFMQITFQQLPFHCCALVCQPISGLGIPQEMLTHLPYLLDWLSSWHIIELVMKSLISTCLQALRFATSSSICPPCISLPSPRETLTNYYLTTVSLILHLSIYHLLSKSHGPGIYTHRGPGSKVSTLEYDPISPSICPPRSYTYQAGSQARLGASPKSVACSLLSFSYNMKARVLT